MNLEYPQSYAYDGGYSGVYDAASDYSKIDYESLKKEGDSLFIKAFDSQNFEDKKKYYRMAMQKYYLLSKAFPGDYYSYVQMARIQDEQNMDKLAKKNYSRALNIDSKNPYTNFYVAEFFVKRRFYHDALKYYLIAYNNGYENNYVMNMRLANLYEKLGDLKKSKNLYKKCMDINPSEANLNEKINSIDVSSYEKSGYYNLIRE